MFCANCGKEIDDNAYVCINCGVAVANTKPPGKDSPSFFYSVMGFFFPVIGLILCLVFENSKPLTAKAFRNGAIWGFVLHCVLVALVVIFYALIFASVFSGIAGSII